jgi:hypothetical protein
VASTTAAASGDASGVNSIFSTDLLLNYLVGLSIDNCLDRRGNDVNWVCSLAVQDVQTICTYVTSWQPSR